MWRNKCRLCDSNKLLKYRIIDSENTIYKCEKCEFVQLPAKSANELDDLANEESIKQDKFRKTTKADMEINNNVKFPKVMRNLAHVIQEDTKRVSKVIEELVVPNIDKDIKFIDIGSGYGHIGFSIGNNNSNIDVHLLETSQERIEMGISTFKPEMNKFTFHHKLLDSSFGEEYYEYFDITLSFHVLEHVYDMVEFIKNIHNITKNGGYIVLEVPNEDDDLQNLSNNYEKIVRFTAHVSYFTKNTLLLLLEKAGIPINNNVNFIGVQRYGFFNYIDWLRHNDKELVLSDDYIPRDKISWIEDLWIKTKQKNLTTDSIMMIIKKI